MRTVTKIEKPAHRILGHTKLLRELELRPAPLAPRLVDRELRGNERRQHGAVLSGMAGAVPRQRLACLHVAFERRNHAVNSVGARLVLCFALAQSLGDPGEADEPPSLLLTLQRISIAEPHAQFPRSALVSPS